MIKEIVIILIILILVTTLGVYEQKYINDNANELIFNLNEIKSQIIEQKQDNAIKNINNVNNKWENIEGKLSILIDHEHLDNIGESITILKTGLEKNEKENILKEIEKTIFLLKDIQDINRIKLKNIF